MLLNENNNYWPWHVAKPTTGCAFSEDKDRRSRNIQWSSAFRAASD